jgi:hypothetical protein
MLCFLNIFAETIGEKLAIVTCIGPKKLSQYVSVINTNANFSSKNGRKWAKIEIMITYICRPLAQRKGVPSPLPTNEVDLFPKKLFTYVPLRSMHSTNAEPQISECQNVEK